MTSKKEVLTQNESTDTNRRKALKLAAGGGLVSGAALTSNTWTKPVVNAVLLPAHAQTSEEPTTFSGSTTAFGKSPTMDRNSILDLFVTPVNAGDVQGGLEEGGFEQLISVDTIEAFATQTGDDAFDFQFRITLFPMSCDGVISKDQLELEFQPGQIIIEESDSISLFFEISASGGSGETLEVITNCDGSETQGINFNYIASDETIDVSNFVFDVDGTVSFGNSISLMPGGEPLVAADCTLCPAPELADT